MRLKVLLLLIATVIFCIGCLRFKFEDTQRLLLPITEYFYSSGVFRIPASNGKPFVILTIDDAPSSRTDEILDLLSEHNATATFFVHTDHLSGKLRMAAIRRLIQEGHEIGHHMPKDGKSVRMTRNEFEAAFDRAEKSISILRPPSSPKYFRAAGGFYNSAVMGPSLERHGYHEPLAPLGIDRRYFMASFMPWDAGGATETTDEAKNRATAERFGRVMAEAMFHGAIIVFHDGEQNNRHERLKWSLISLEVFLRNAQLKGYTVYSLSDGIEAALLEEETKVQ